MCYGEEIWLQWIIGCKQLPSYGWIAWPTRKLRCQLAYPDLTKHSQDTENEFWQQYCSEEFLKRTINLISSTQWHIGGAICPETCSRGKLARHLQKVRNIVHASEEAFAMWVSSSLPAGKHSVWSPWGVVQAAISLGVWGRKIHHSTVALLLHR